MLRERAVAIQQFPAQLFQRTPPNLTPPFGLAKFREETSDCPQTHALADSVIVSLAEGVIQIRFNPLPRGGNHSRERRHALCGSGTRPEKTVKAKAPRHQPQAGFLAALPVRSGVRR